VFLKYVYKHYGYILIMVRNIIQMIVFGMAWSLLILVLNTSITNPENIDFNFN